MLSQIFHSDPRGEAFEMWAGGIGAGIGALAGIVAFFVRKEANKSFVTLCGYTAFGAVNGAMLGILSIFAAAFALIAAVLFVPWLAYVGVSKLVTIVRREKGSEKLSLLQPRNSRETDEPREDQQTTEENVGKIFDAADATVPPRDESIRATKHPQPSAVKALENAVAEETKILQPANDPPAETPSGLSLPNAIPPGAQPSTPSTTTTNAPVPVDNLVKPAPTPPGASNFFSCFISYSSVDVEFATKLWHRLRKEGIRVWFAPDSMIAGAVMYEQIEEAIHRYDKLLFVLSEASMASDWDASELYGAYKIERETKKRKLFPIRLVPKAAVDAWRCFEADFGKDLARELRRYHIPDFTGWHQEDDFEAEFARLLNALRTQDEPSKMK